jgi:hypothetical protein
MSSEGTLTLVKDGVNIPQLVSEGWEEINVENVLKLPVYTSTTRKHDTRLRFWVDSTALSPMHLHMHEGSSATFYAPVLPYVMRIGTDPGDVVRFDHDLCIQHDKEIRAFEYIVVGNCTTLEGLAAPYDEENTTSIMKIECPAHGTNLQDFWFDQGNKDHFSKKDVRKAEFDQ